VSDVPDGLQSLPQIGYNACVKSANILVLLEVYDHPIRLGIGRYAAEKNWHLTVNDGCMLPAGWKGDGVLTMLINRADIIRYVCRQRVPCVDFGAYRDDLPMARVCGDHRQIGRVAADHLIERGFKQVAYFSTEHQHVSALRGSGFAERFQCATGCEVKQLVWALRPRCKADDWQGLNRWLKRELRAMPKPAAVFCYCDYDAAKVETVCLEAGIQVPHDVAILGVDNDSLVCENVRVPLSSVRHDRVRIGYEGSALLDRLIRGGKAPSAPVLIPPCGVELRASTDAFASSDPLVRAAVTFFRGNLGRSIGVDDASAAVGLPRHQLERHFASVLNESVHATLMRLRLFEVKRLLALTDMPVKEIAARTGFCHAQHLSNAFKRFEGSAPQDYRKSEKRLSDPGLRGSASAG
jgi:LacI family transcriptional regulator